MRTYSVTCIEKLPSGNWRVQAETGTPFVLVERMGRWKTPCVIWMRDPHPGRTVTIRMPDWRAMRNRQLVGDALYEANLKRKRDLAARRKTGADPQLWDRRYRTARGSLSTAEQTLAKFSVTDGEKAAMTRTAVEARGGKVVEMRPGLLMAMEGRLRGRIYDEDVVKRPDDPVFPTTGASEADSRGSDGGSSPEASSAGICGSNSASGRPEPTSSD